jgi:hypothetical protein
MEVLVCGHLEMLLGFEELQLSVPLHLPNKC